MSADVAKRPCTPYIRCYPAVKASMQGHSVRVRYHLGCHLVAGSVLLGRDALFQEIIYE